jgi:hypothetical protein
VPEHAVLECKADATRRDKGAVGQNLASHFVSYTCEVMPNRVSTFAVHPPGLTGGKLTLCVVSPRQKRALVAKGNRQLHPWICKQSLPILQVMFLGVVAERTVADFQEIGGLGPDSV